MVVPYELVLQGEFGIRSTFDSMDNGWLKGKLIERHGEDGFERISTKTLEDVLVDKVGEKPVGRLKGWLRKKLRGRDYKTHMGRILGMKSFEVLQRFAQKDPLYKITIDVLANNSVSWAAQAPNELGVMGLTIKEHLVIRSTGVPMNSVEGPVYRRFRDYLFIRFQYDKPLPEKKTSLGYIAGVSKKFALQYISTIVPGMPIYWTITTIGMMSDRGFDPDKLITGTGVTLFLCTWFSPVRNWWLDKCYAFCGLTPDYKQEQQPQLPPPDQPH